jgi:hypothetical protein
MLPVVDVTSPLHQLRDAHRPRCKEVKAPPSGQFKSYLQQLFTLNVENWEARAGGKSKRRGKIERL